MFADMTEEEKSSYTGFNVSQALESLGPVEQETFPQFLSNPSCELVLYGLTITIPLSLRLTSTFGAKNKKHFDLIWWPHHLLS